MTDTPPERIYHVSQAQLSVARFYGGIRYNGHLYTYNPVDDSLTRNDVLKAEGMAKKAEKREMKAKKKADKPPENLTMF